MPVPVIPELALTQCALGELTGWRESHVNKRAWQESEAQPLGTEGLSSVFLSSLWNSFSPLQLHCPILAQSLAPLTPPPSCLSLSLLAFLPPLGIFPGSQEQSGQEFTLVTRTEAKSCQAWASSMSLICRIGTVLTSQCCCKAITPSLSLLETLCLHRTCPVLVCLSLNGLFTCMSPSPTPKDVLTIQGSVHHTKCHHIPAA